MNCGRRTDLLVTELSGGEEGGRQSLPFKDLAAIVQRGVPGQEGWFVGDLWSMSGGHPHFLQVSQKA